MSHDFVSRSSLDIDCSSFGEVAAHDVDLSKGDAAVDAILAACLSRGLASETQVTQEREAWLDKLRAFC